jgi:hypothetical protein
VVLAVLGAVVLVAGVYLFLEVRASPASAEAGSTTHPAVTRTAENRDTPSAPGHAIAHPVATGAGTTGTTTGGVGTPPPSVPDTDDVDAAERANPTLDAIMDRANKAYDHQDWDEAKAIAGKVLSKQPNNVRMLRILVSVACIESDTTTAQKNFELLPPADRAQMKLRCDKQYGVALKDPAQ